MDTSNINPQTFQLLYEKVEDIKQLLEKEKNDYPLQDRWLDISEACQILFVSKRTLQSYRDNGILPFSQLGGKIYFKASDIQKHLEKHYKKAFAVKK
ncbi:MAG TPA: helix-turn-helix domain-containing protein [Bacteroidales bacterium]|nr:helix-turn-helix domain-containing protein [Bacteroidales bacterium]